MSVKVCQKSIISLGNEEEEKKWHRLSYQTHFRRIDGGAFIGHYVEMVFQFTVKIWCGYLLELPQWGISYKHPQHAFTNVFDLDLINCATISWL